MTCEKLLFIGVLIFLVFAGAGLLVWILNRILEPNTAKVRTELVFSPQKTITAFELAKLMPLILNKGNAKSLQMKVDALPKHIKRHIRDGR